MKKLVAVLKGQGLGLTVVRASIGSAGLRLAGLGFGLLLALQLARALGPASYGIYGTAMAIIALMTVVAELGMPRLTTREIASAEAAQDWGRLRGVLIWSRRVALGISSIFILAVAAWASFNWESDTSLLTTLLIGIAWVPLVTLGNLEAAALVGLRHFMKGQMPEVLLRPALFSMALLLAALFSFDLSPMLAMGLGVASAAISTLVASILLRQNLPSKARRERPSIQSKFWLKSAVPIALSEGVRIGQTQVVILLLAVMVADAETGMYRAAASIFALFVLPEAMFNLVCGPIISRLLAQRDNARLQKLLSYAAVASTLFTGLLVCPFILFGADLVSLILGEDFRAASTPLLILGVAAVLIAATGPGLVLMSMAGHDKEVVTSGGVAFTVLLVVAGPLIMWMGVNGAAVAFATSSLLWRIMVRQKGLRMLRLDPSLASLRFTTAD